MRNASGTEAPELAAVLLAAGYGTRLGAMGERTPKALLPVPGEGRPVLDLLLAELADVPGLAEVTVVTNRRFLPPIAAWAATARRTFPVPLRLLCDETWTPEERLGAVGDLAFVLERTAPERDRLVLATDTVYRFPLAAFVDELPARTAADVLVAVVEESPEHLSRRGVAVLDDEDRLVRFQEKPEEPASSDTVPPLYLFRARVLPLVRTYLDGGGDPDAPGHLLEWLVSKVRVEGWRAPAGRIDLGNAEELGHGR